MNWTILTGSCPASVSTVPQVRTKPSHISCRYAPLLLWSGKYPGRSGHCPSCTCRDHRDFTISVSLSYYLEDSLFRRFLIYGIQTVRSLCRRRRLRQFLRSCQTTLSDTANHQRTHPLPRRRASLQNSSSARQKRPPSPPEATSSTTVQSGCLRSATTFSTTSQGRRST